MNYFKQNVFFLGLMAMLSCSLLLVSCGNDDDATDDGGSNGEVTLDDLSALIADAESLLDGATEGTLGGYFYGAIAKLQSVIDDAQGLVDDGETDADLIDLGFDLLEEAIAAFNESIITFEGNPWVQQVAGNTIILTDNIEGGGIEGGLLSLIEDTRDFTIELEFNPVSLNLLGDDAPMLSTAKQLNEVQGEPDVDDGFYLRHFADGNIRYTTGQPGQNGDENWSWQRIQEADAEASLTGFAAGKWNHIALVHEGENRRVYVNGILAQEGTSGYADISDREDVLGIYLGGTPDWTNRVANGLFKNVRIWSTVLSDTELNQDVAAVGDGLEAWFPMEYENAAEFADVSGFYKAVLTDLVVWAPNGDVTQIEVDYSELETLISNAETFLAGITEGKSAGEFGVGTADYLQPFIDESETFVGTGGLTEVAQAVIDLSSALEFAEANIVDGGVADGFRNDGEDGYVYVNGYKNVPGLSFTLEFEYKPTLVTITNSETNETSQILGNGGNILGNGAYGLFHNGADGSGLRYHYRFTGETGDGDAENDWSDIYTDDGVLAEDTWYHIALVYNADTDEQILYVDGVELGKLSGVGDIQFEGWDGMLIGAEWGHCKGTFKDLRIWNEAKAAEDLDAEIADVASETTLEVYAPFNFKDAPLTVDETGNYTLQHNGEIIWNDPQ